MEGRDFGNPAASIANIVCGVTRTDTSVNVQSASDATGDVRRSFGRGLGEE
jgi:hypothetical protein